ncbi:MAG: hypothetical protein A2849_01545 [Candidatus Taylorbacteria bacterium RIFCSPHIGHO2_01_FULL_51_15]|uniref:Uncharacterized protein n=1 Tax=Candidatus Taylorbacteria bacterium RIFCSPHIGHO2_01_FULL_51_15 TaxID=1802304 RepID=A0A1G2MBB2_9BACT|nr:MAG: hypothetical protein A2849_01545 [Candidatus Taylorbacteria bacterium RIFCSPHIGHO2_01_FULL_51_15]
METIVNNPTPTGEGSGSWTLVGIVIGVILVLVVLYFGIPALRDNMSGDTDTDTKGVEIDVNLPGGTSQETEGAATTD